MKYAPEEFQTRRGKEHVPVSELTLDECQQEICRLYEILMVTQEAVTDISLKIDKAME